MGRPIARSAPGVELCKLRGAGRKTEGNEMEGREDHEANSALRVQDAVCDVGKGPEQYGEAAERGNEFRFQAENF